MGKRVLVAVDSDPQSEGSIMYGIHLAARIESGVVVIAGSRRKDKKRSRTSQVRLKDLDRAQHGWLEHAICESRKRSVNMEIFVTPDELFDEVVRFVQSQPTIQFVVFAVPSKGQGSYLSSFNASLSRLRRAFEGEILVVEKVGEITRVSDVFPQSSVKGNSV